MRVFDLDKTCIAKPLYHGSSFFEFSCGKGGFVEGDTSLPATCPFCGKPVNSLVEVESK